MSENSNDSDQKKIEKLEETVKFLRKELESQNMAILRLERALETGDGISNTPEKPSLTLADMEFVIFGIEEKLKKHNELIKNIVISLVGTNDLLEELRDLYRTSLGEIKLEQEEHMRLYQKILSGSLESIRVEFLMVLRDFREKYPDLETRKLEKQLLSKKEPIFSPTRNLESDIWTNEQLYGLENLELSLERNINDSMNSILEMLNYLAVKTEYLNQIVLDKKKSEIKLSKI
jgi:hypothetical protein